MRKENQARTRPPITYTGVNHLALVTGNMNVTIRFWRDLLGMELVAGVGHPGYRHYFFHIGQGNMVAFFEWPGVEPMVEKDHGAPITGAVGFDHVSLSVACAEDLWRLKARLEGAGVWCSELVDHGFIHSLYAFDPNNIPVEFSAYVEGTDILGDPRMLDTEPTREALEGPCPVDAAWPAPAEVVPGGERRVYPGNGEDILDPAKNSWRPLRDRWLLETEGRAGSEETTQRLELARLGAELLAKLAAGDDVDDGLADGALLVLTAAAAADGGVADGCVRPLAHGLGGLLGQGYSERCVAVDLQNATADRTSWLVPTDGAGRGFRLEMRFVRLTDGWKLVLLTLAGAD